MWFFAQKPHPQPPLQPMERGRRAKRGGGEVEIAVLSETEVTYSVRETHASTAGLKEPGVERQRASLPDLWPHLRSTVRAVVVGFWQVAAKYEFSNKNIDFS